MGAVQPEHHINPPPGKDNEDAIWLVVRELDGADAESLKAEIEQVVRERLAGRGELKAGTAPAYTLKFLYSRR